jgi:hypothetical protein
LEALEMWQASYTGEAFIQFKAKGLLMLYDSSRARSGDMPEDLQAKVDSLLQEFMGLVDALVEERHLQRGIARSQLPSSMVAILDRESLFILAQLRPEDRISQYLINPNVAFTPEKAHTNAQWEFGFEDPFVIQFPACVLDQSPAQRRAALEKIVNEHIESELLRFISLLGLMRTRPIFGPVPAPVDSQTALLLLPLQGVEGRNHQLIASVAESMGWQCELPEDIRKGKAAVRELWMSINQSRVTIADLTGADPAVMYALGIAHAVGRETILIRPKGSKLLTDIPRTRGIEYEEGEEGRKKLEEHLREILDSMQQAMAE